MKASHRIFATNVAAGYSQTEAYLAAFPRSRSRDAARANASRLMAKDSIKAEVDRIRRENETDLMLTYREKREFLARVVRNYCQRDLDVLKAIALDNKMAGHDRMPASSAPQVTLEAILRDLESTPIVDPTGHPHRRIV